MLNLAVGMFSGVEAKNDGSMEEISSKTNTRNLNFRMLNGKIPNAIRKELVQRLEIIRKINHAVGFITLPVLSSLFYTVNPSFSP